MSEVRYLELKPGERLECEEGRTSEGTNGIKYSMIVARASEVEGQAITAGPMIWVSGEPVGSATGEGANAWLDELPKGMLWELCGPVQWNQESRRWEDTNSAFIRDGDSLLIVDQDSQLPRIIMHIGGLLIRKV